MILIFASNLHSEDIQTEVLKKELKKQKKVFQIINPLNLKCLQNWSLSNKNNKLNLLHNDIKLNIKKVYMSRLWRTDCVIDFPPQCTYPTFLRHKIENFMLEISSMLHNCCWTPGNLENIQMAESKCFLLNQAYKQGLNIPTLTLNSFHKSSNNYYRKVLGFPFSITLDTETNTEVAVTLFNNKGPHNSVCSEFPWQWQSYIKPKKHIRCIFIHDHLWSCESGDDIFQGKSLREVQEDTQINWVPHYLPENIKSKLILLMHKLNLSIACPEFIIDTNNKYIFIDLNPCGDWFGFFNQNAVEQIVSRIVSKL